jgi:hypothetical protein
MSKLIHLDTDNFMGVMQDIIHAFKNDSLTELILIARIVDKNAARIRYSWHGKEGCINALGLLEYMNLLIRDYIRSNNEEE